MSIWHWIVVLVYFASATIPFYKLFPRAGVPRWIALFGILPGAPLGFLWMLAFMKWPEDK